MNCLGHLILPTMMVLHVSPRRKPSSRGHPVAPLACQALRLALKSKPIQVSLKGSCGVDRTCTSRSRNGKPVSSRGLARERREVSRGRGKSRMPSFPTTSSLVPSRSLLSWPMRANSLSIFCAAADLSRTLPRPRTRRGADLCPASTWGRVGRQARQQGTFGLCARSPSVATRLPRTDHEEA
jgi:hypothetical protein